MTLHFTGPSIRKFGIVVSSVVAAVLLTFPLASKLVHSRDLLFVAAVILVARYEGGTAGISAALLSVVAFDWFFDRTPGKLDFAVGDAVRVIVFVSLSGLIALLDGHRRQAMQRLAATNQTLQRTLAELKTLHGILPICSYCKRIEAGPDHWIELENYVRKHSDAEFSHGLCPECLQKLSPKS